LNKQDFIEFLKDPSSMSAANLEELEQVVKRYPYFQSARTILAKRKNEIDPKSAKIYINKAAVYVPDRAYLKKYLDDQLVFVEDPDRKPPPKPEVSKTESPKSKPSEAPRPKSKGVDVDEILKFERTPLDELIDEIYQDIEDLKASKERFKNWEKKFDEEEAVNSAIAKASKSKTKEESASPKAPKAAESDKETPAETDEVKAPKK